MGILSCGKVNYLERKPFFLVLSQHTIAGRDSEIAPTEHRSL